MVYPHAYSGGMTDTDQAQHAGPCCESCIQDLETGNGDDLEGYCCCEAIRAEDVDAPVHIKPGPTSEQLVAAIPHLTYRRLDWWIRQGYLPDDEDGAITHDTGSGHQRRFHPRQVLALRHMAHLVGQGVTVDRAADAASVAEHMWDGTWRYRVPSPVVDEQLAVLTFHWRLPPSQTAELADVLEVGLP